MFRRVLSAAVLLFVVAAVAAAADPIRYKFKEGDKISYEQETKMKMEMDLLGRSIVIEMTQTLDSTMTVGKVDADGSAAMTQTFDRVRMKMNGPMGETEFDTKDGKAVDNPLLKGMADMMADLVGGEATFRMSARGKVEKTALSEKLKKSLANSPANALGGLGGGGGGGGDLMTEDGLKKLIEQSGFVLPEDLKTKGETWNGKVEAKTPFATVTTDTKYTYEGQEERGGRKLEKISLKPTIKVEPDPAAPVAMTLKSAEAKGHAYFDAAAGRIRESSATQKLEMEIDAMGQKMTQKTTTEVTVKLKDAAK